MQDDAAVEVDEQTVALFVDGEQERSIGGHRSASRSWCSRRGASQSLTSRDPRWRCVFTWASSAISQDRIFAPVWGAEQVLKPGIHGSLSLSCKPVTMGFYRALSAQNLLP